MNEDIKKNLKNSNTWSRGLYMLLFLIVYGVAEVVISVVVIAQFFIVLFSGKRNEKLLKLGKELATFVYDIIEFITYNSDEKPFPFNEWKSSIDTKV